jgi:hypothetical protein
LCFAAARREAFRLSPRSKAGAKKSCFFEEKGAMAASRAQALFHVKQNKNIFRRQIAV